MDLSLLLLVFSLIFTVVSRLLLLYSTIDKTSLFEDNGLLFWVPDVLCWHSEVVLWNFLAVGGVVWVACQGFLVREACVSVLVGRAGFLLSGMQ